MVMRHFGVICVLVFVSACDHFPGPHMVNEFPTDITATIVYSDGQVVRWPMPRCVHYHVGIPHVAIENLSIENEGKVLHQWSANDVRAMLEKEKTVKGSPEWIIGSNGIVLVDRFEVNHCSKQSE